MPDHKEQSKVVWGGDDEARLREIFAEEPSALIADMQDERVYGMVYVPEPDFEPAPVPVRRNHPDPAEGPAGYIPLPE